MVAAGAANTPAIDGGDGYFFGGRWVPLTRAVELAAVRFRSSLSLAGQTLSLQTVSVGATIEPFATPPSTRLTLVRLAVPGQSGAATRSSVDVLHAAQSTLQDLNDLPDVEFAFPVLVNPTTGRKLIPTDEIVAKLVPGVTAESVTAAGALRAIRTLWGTTDEVLFQLTNPKTQSPLTVANELVRSGRVLWAEPSFLQEYQTAAAPNDPQFASQWHLHNTAQNAGATADADVDAPEAWDLTTGSSGITIAVIDNGVETTHEDLAAGIYTNAGETPGDGLDNDGNGYIDDVNGWDFYRADNNANPAISTDNHGTAVAGVAAGRGNNSVGISGACQSCRILPVKVAEGSSSFATDTVIADAIRYAASFADALNNSWGGGAPSSVIQSAIQWARTNGRGGRGSAVLFASGNGATGAQLRRAPTTSGEGFPVGTYRIRFEYAKDASGSAGDDTVWLPWIYFTTGETLTFESGALPSGCTTGGTGGGGGWSTITDPTHTDEGFGLTRVAKAATIGDSQSTYIDCVRTFSTIWAVYTYAWASSPVRDLPGGRLLQDSHRPGGERLIRKHHLLRRGRAVSRSERGLPGCTP